MHLKWILLALLSLCQFSSSNGIPLMSKDVLDAHVANSLSGKDMDDTVVGTTGIKTDSDTADTEIDSMHEVTDTDKDDKDSNESYKKQALSHMGQRMSNENMAPSKEMSDNGVSYSNEDGYSDDSNDVDDKTGLIEDLDDNETDETDVDGILESLLDEKVLSNGDNKLSVSDERSEYDTTEMSDSNDFNSIGDDKDDMIEGLTDDDTDKRDILGDTISILGSLLDKRVTDSDQSMSRETVDTDVSNSNDDDKDGTVEDLFEDDTDERRDVLADAVSLLGSILVEPISNSGHLISRETIDADTSESDQLMSREMADTDATDSDQLMSGETVDGDLLSKKDVSRDQSMSWETMDDTATNILHGIDTIENDKDAMSDDKDDIIEDASEKYTDKSFMNDIQINRTGSLLRKRDASREQSSMSRETLENEASNSLDSIDTTENSIDDTSEDKDKSEDDSRNSIGSIDASENDNDETSDDNDGMIEDVFYKYTDESNLSDVENDSTGSLLRKRSISREQSMSRESMEDDATYDADDDRDISSETDIDTDETDENDSNSNASVSK